MSLLDMINFNLGHFVWALKLLSQERQIAMVHAVTTPDDPVSAEDIKRAISNLSYVKKSCDELVLSSACNRAERTMIALHRHADGHETLTCDGLQTHCQVLQEAIDDDIRFERFFHYGNHRAQRLLQFRIEWGISLTKFPSLEKEIEEGIDCYGLEHHTASVFHMMRVAEIGMRALARERRVTFPKHPIEWAEWQRIITEIENSARDFTTPMSRGPAKDAALAFYSGAIGQLHGFKDTFRNAVMHVRRSYDELDAQRAMTQVRDFMNGLSAKIGETTRRPIRRWP